MNLQDSIDAYEKKCQVESLPVLYSDYCDVKTKKHVTAIGKVREWFVDTANNINREPTKEYLISPSDLEDELGIQKEIQQSQGERLETGNLEDLNDALNKAIADRNFAVNRPMTDDLSLKQQFEDNTAEYFEHRLYHHAEEITQIIQALIEYDMYPEHWFGKFREIREKIFVEDDPKIANRMLGQLIRIGRSQLPRNVKQEDAETIDSNSASPNNVAGG